MNNIMKRKLLYILFFILTLLSVIPFWIVLVNATRSAEQIQQSVSLIPGSNFMNNLRVLLSGGFDIVGGFKNSFIISISSTVLNVYISSLTAYSFVAYDFKGRKLIFGLVLCLLMIPGQISMVGFYQMMNNFNLLNSFIPLILPAAAAPGTVFFLKQYLDTIYHKDLADSARLDGAGEFKIFHSIFLPLMKPGIATMAIFSFVSSWNNFLMPLILINDSEKYTLPMWVQMLKTDIYSTQFGSMYLGMGLSVIPLIIIYLILSRHIIGGVAAGGIKE